MGSKRVDIGKKELIQLYEIDGLGAGKISKKLNCCEQTIYKYLKSYGIQTREAYSLSDMVGKRYGLLSVLKRIGSNKCGKAQWLCKCDCGNEKIITGHNLRTGHTKSCGCVKSTGRPNSRVVIYCVICNKENSVTKSRVRHNTTCGSKECQSESKSRRSGENHPQWLNGMAKYDIAKAHFKDIEDIRRSPSDPRILEVKCLYCDRWFQPTKAQVSNRKLAIVHGVGGNRFYCSDGCKEACPIYGRPKYPKGFRKATSREVDPDLRKMVLERDDWECQKCGSDCNLHVHHIESYAQNKMIANDMDNCITLCKACHKWVHTLEGCNYFELRCGPSPIIGTALKLPLAP